MESSDASPATLGRSLTEARTRGGLDVPSGLSVRELARRAGVSAAQVSRIESSHVRKPSRETIVAMARGEDAAELRELMNIWRYIGGHRHELLEYGRALRHLADLEYRAVAETDRVSRTSAEAGSCCD